MLKYDTRPSGDRMVRASSMADSRASFSTASPVFWADLQPGANWTNVSLRNNTRIGARSGCDRMDDVAWGTSGLGCFTKP